MVPCYRFTYVVISFIMLSLSACGFHLRGMSNLPPSFNPIAVINQNRTVAHEMVAELKKMLVNDHHHLVDETLQANYLIILESDELEQSLTNVSASTTPRQYQLTYTLHAQVIQKNGRPLFATQNIRVQRQATINNDRILGSNYELDLILKEMHQDAALQLLMRINRALIS